MRRKEERRGDKEDGWKKEKFKGRRRECGNGFKKEQKVRKKGVSRVGERRGEGRRQRGSLNITISYYVQFRDYAKAARRANTLKEFIPHRAQSYFFWGETTGDMMN